MKNAVLKKEAVERIRRIHRLSRAYNKRKELGHGQKLLEMMKHHVVEIEELLKKQDRHALVETGDLVVLCCEMLMENKASVDGMLLRSLDRFEKKLNRLKRKGRSKE